MVVGVLSSSSLSSPLPLSCVMSPEAAAERERGRERRLLPPSSLLHHLTQSILLPPTYLRKKWESTYILSSLLVLHLVNCSLLCTCVRWEGQKFGLSEVLFDVRNGGGGGEIEKALLYVSFFGKAFSFYRERYCDCCGGGRGDPRRNRDSLCRECWRGGE